MIAMSGLSVLCIWLLTTAKLFDGLSMIPRHE